MAQGRAKLRASRRSAPRLGSGGRQLAESPSLTLQVTEGVWRVPLSCGMRAEGGDSQARACPVSVPRAGDGEIVSRNVFGAGFS